MPDCGHWMHADNPMMFVGFLESGLDHIETEIKINAKKLGSTS